MVQVAVIDNGIRKEYKKYIKQGLTVTHSGVYECKNYHCSNMHANICVHILKKFYNDCEIFSLDIFNDNEKTDINLLECALLWCLENNIDVVSLSIGSCYIEDAGIIKPIINKLLDNNTYIIASANNHNSITFPASLDGVIGVKCDLSNVLNEGEIVVDTKDIRKIEVSVGSLKNNNELIKYNLGYNNSFVVPYIAAKVCFAIGQEMDVWEFLESQSEKTLNSDFYLRSFPLMYKPEPIVIELDCLRNSLLKECIELFEGNGYCAISILDENDGKKNCYALSDFPWISKENVCEYIIKALNPDIVFVLKNFASGELERDCIVKIDENATEYHNKAVNKLNNEEFPDEHMQYIGNYGNYGICVSDAMESIDPENFYFEGDIDEETKKRILEAIASGEVSNESDKNDIEIIEIKEEQINILVSIIEDIFG